MGKKGNTNGGWLFKLKITLLLVAAIGSVTCRKTATPKPTIDSAAHASEIQKWQSDRLASLTKEDGWLTLIGLYWLKEGANDFGSDAKNEIVLPKDKAPSKAGSFHLSGNEVSLIALPGTGLSIVSDAKTEPAPLTLKLKDDNAEEGPTVVKLNSLLLTIVKRGDRMGVRVKDTQSQTLKEFKGLEYYPIDSKWRIEARVELYQTAKFIPITNVLGMTEDNISPGALVFDVDGKTYRIDPILEQGETDWFVMIADETTGKETYGAGRYLYVKPPDAGGHTVIDFNKAYSPPCAFTSYATCPLPPQQNHLPFRIDAGEKKYAGTAH
ncbi:MAG TPA: DUF1684 domain-containing protein [Pyrinomonadaceae bacterium]|nr:DUF1684 domain-containing protein [Pyrinomonadaceae bacterium]